MLGKTGQKRIKREETEERETKDTRKRRMEETPSEDRGMAGFNLYPETLSATGITGSQ